MHTLGGAFLCGSHHLGRRQRDHGQVDIAGDVAHRCERGEALNVGSGAVDKEQASGESALEHVAHQRPIGGVRVKRRSDQRYRAWGKETLDRRLGRERVSALEVDPGFVARRSRELRVHLTRLGAEAQRESALPKQLEHSRVVGLDDGLEHLDACVRRRVCKLGEQQEPKAATLERIGDGEAHLRPPAARDDVDGVADHLCGRGCNQPEL